MKTIKDHQKSGIYCPWNNRFGVCISCMVMIEIEENKFICGRLYPPEHFKEEVK